MCVVDLAAPATHVPGRACWAQLFTVRLLVWSLLALTAAMVWLAASPTGSQAGLPHGGVQLVADAAAGAADGSGTSDQPSTDGSGSQPKASSGGSNSGSGSTGSDSGSGSGASSGGAQAQDGSGSTDSSATDGSQSTKPAATPNAGSGTPAPATNNAPAPAADGSSTAPANDGCPDGGCAGRVPGQPSGQNTTAAAPAERANTPEEQCKVNGGCDLRPLARTGGNADGTAVDGAAEACRDGGPGCNPLAVVASRTTSTTTGADPNDTYAGIGGNQPQSCAPGKPCPGSDQPATPALPGGPSSAGPGSGTGGAGHGGAGAATLADRAEGLDPDQLRAITAVAPRNPNYGGLSAEEIRGPPTPLVPTSGDLDELQNQMLSPLLVPGQRYTPQLSGGAASPLKAQRDPYQLAAAGGMPLPRAEAEQGEQPLPPTAATRPGRSPWGSYIDDRANAETPEWFRSGPRSWIPNLTQHFTADTADGLYAFTGQLLHQRQISVPEAEQLAQQRWAPALKGNLSKLGRDYWEQPGPTLAQDIKALTKPDRDTGADFFPLALGNAAGGLRDTAWRMIREQNMYEGPHDPARDLLGMSRQEYERKMTDDPYGFTIEKLGDATLITGGAGTISKVGGGLGRGRAAAEGTGPSLSRPSVGVPRRELEEGAPALTRQDSDFYGMYNHKGDLKAHRDEYGNVFPANPNGAATILQHITGKVGKSDSSYTSWSGPNSTPKDFGNEVLKLNRGLLERDIASGRLPGVEIIPAERIQRMIREDANRIAGREVDISLPRDLDDAEIKGEAQRLAQSIKGLDQRQMDGVMQRARDLANTSRDDEWLTKGIIPKKYTEGPFPK